MPNGVGKLYLLYLWVVIKKPHFFSSPSPLSSWDPWHWRRSEDSVRAFRLKGKTLITDARLPSLRSFSKTSHETCLANTFCSSTISPAWAALLQNTLCRLQVVSYGKLQVITTPSAPWQKQQQMKKTPTNPHIPFFLPFIQKFTEMQNQTFFNQTSSSLWRH